MHAGSTATHRRAAELELVEIETARIAEKYAIGPGVDTLTALQEALNTSYEVMRFWQQQVRELQSLSERGQAGSVDVHHYVRAEERARAALLRVATDCARLGIEVKRAAIDERSARALAAALLDAIEQLGGDPNDPRVRTALATALRRVNQPEEVER